MGMGARVLFVPRTFIPQGNFVTKQLLKTFALLTLLLSAYLYSNNYFGLHCVF